ncbi:MAG: trypsin-like peptidase domain-containing protein [Chloroflexota bacterium]|nr:trypsin-like peptidase domain-containing protein [Chloroflexota bacterium]
MVTAVRSSVVLAGGLSGELAALAEQVRAGVVEVSDGRGTGAGTIWTSDGLIVTNHHVVPGETARVTLVDDTVLDARVIASLPERDLSLLKIDATDLPVLPIGDSATLRPGEIVMAVGHPHGVPGVVTFGVFSRVGPYEGRTGRHLREGLLADIELRPGNSGGPLVNARGEVIGINAMVLGPGTALAIPSATAGRLIDYRERRTLGMQVGVVQNTPSIAGRDGLTQEHLVMVLDVASASVAAHAGLLPGDILLALDGESIEEPGDIAWALAGAVPDDAISLTILRAGQRKDGLLTPAS